MGSMAAVWKTGNLDAPGRRRRPEPGSGWAASRPGSGRCRRSRRLSTAGVDAAPGKLAAIGGAGGLFRRFSHVSLVIRPFL